MLTRYMRGAVFLAWLAGWATLIGCAGAIIPVSTHTKTPEDHELKEKVSTNFITAGQTTKADVLAKVQPVDAGVESDRFFLARWSTSNKWYFLVACGYIDCMGGGGRYWKTSNALVEFDDQGVVSQYAVFSDNSLIPKLSPLAAQETGVSFDPPREAYGELPGEGDVTLVLSRNTLGIKVPGSDKHNFQIDRTDVKDIRRIGLVSFPRTPVQIRFTKKVKFYGKGITLNMKIPELYSLLEFLSQHP